MDDGAFTGTVAGGAGADVLQGNVLDAVTLTGSDASGFSGIESGGAVASGPVNFTGINTINGQIPGTLTGWNNDATWTLAVLSRTYFDGANTLDIIGFDTLIGGSQQDTFLVTGNVDYDLFGGAGNDTFDIDAVLLGSVDGDAGTDILDLSSALATNVTVTGFEVDNGTTQGGATLTGVTNVQDGASGIDNVIGAANGTITGRDVVSDVWTFDTLDTYNDTNAATPALEFSGFDSVQGGTGDDTFNIFENVGRELFGGLGDDDFVFQTNGWTAFRLDGQGNNGGGDTISYQGYVDGVTVNLTTNTATNVTNFAGFENATGGAGTDSLTGNAGANTFIGNDGSDTLTGGDGNDTMSGGNDGDLYVFDDNFGNDTVNDTGAVGNDTLDFSAVNAAPLFVDLGLTANTVTTGANSVSVDLQQVETLVGSSAAGDDTIRGADQDATWTIDGTTYSTTGVVNITLAFSAFEAIEGGNEDDTFNLLVNALPYTSIDGRGGDDTFTFADGVSFAGQLIGNAGNDTLNYFTFYTSGVNVNLGATTASNVAGGAAGGVTGFETVLGGSGNDTLTGSAGNNSIGGGDGHDSIVATTGADAVDAGPGTDTIDFSAFASVAVDLQTAPNTATATDGANVTTFVTGGANGVESLIGTGGNDSITGQDAVSTWTVGANPAAASSYVSATGPTSIDFTGFETLTGGSLADQFNIPASTTVTLQGGDGNDTFDLTNDGVSAINIDGQGGSNTISYTGYTANVAVNIGTQTATNVTTLVNIQNATGGGGNDNLLGDGAANTLNGGAGSDVITGGAGNDVLTGGSGDDTFVFADGYGNDTVSDALGTDDTIDLSALTTPVTFVLNGALSTITDGNGDVITFNPAEIENIILPNNTTFTGGNGPTNEWDVSGTTVTYFDGTNTITLSNVTAIQGGFGPDLFRINGNTTVDMFGGLGDDEFRFTADSVTASDINGQGGTDLLSYAGYTSAVLVDLASVNATTGLTSHAGLENATGGDGNDTIFGNTADNLLVGGLGNDVIFSSDGGNDTVNGGGDDDRYVFLDQGPVSNVTILAGTGNDAIRFDAVPGVSTGYLLDLSVNLQTGSISYVGNSVTFTPSDIDSIASGSGSDTLQGADAASTWSLGATFNYASGAIDIDFSGFETAQGGNNIDTFNVTEDITLNLRGGVGADVFNLGDGDSLTGSIAGEADTDTLNLSATATTNATIDSLAAIGANLSGVTNVSGGATGIDSLTGSAGGTLTAGGVGDNFWNLDGLPTFEDALIGPNVLAFSGFADLQGNGGIDTFNVTAATSYNVLGGGGADVVNLSDVLTGNVTTEGGQDAVRFLVPAGQLNGNLNGGSSVTLDYSLLAGPIFVTLTGNGTVDGFQGMATGIVGTFDNVNDVIGSMSVIDVLTGQDADADWDLDGTPSYDNTLAGAPARSLTFTGVESLVGGTANDEFNLISGNFTGTLSGANGGDEFDITAGATLTGNIVGGNGNDTLTGTGADAVTVTGSDATGFSGTEDSIIGAGTFAGINTINGTGTFFGNNVASTWTINGATVTYFDGTNTVTLTGFATYQGGTAVDTFNVVGANPTAINLNGGDEVAPLGDIYNLSATLLGNINAQGGDDDINFLAGGAVDGNVNGGSSATLDFSAQAGPVTVSLTADGTIDGFQGTATGITGTFNNITTLVGSAGDDTLNGLNTTDTSNWALDGAPTYDHGTAALLEFSGVENLQGNSGPDAFVVTAATSANLFGGGGADTFTVNGATLTGQIAGNDGNDTLTGTSIDNVTLTGSNIFGYQGQEANVTGGFLDIEHIDGTAAGSITGENVASAWTLNGANRTYDDLSGSTPLTFTGFDTLNGGNNVDTFTVAGTVGTAVTLNGNAGNDTFVIDAATNNVTVVGKSVANGGENDTLQGVAINVVTLTASALDTGYTGTEADITGGFSAINTITGDGLPGSVLTGRNTDSTWGLDGSPTYNDNSGNGSLNFSGFTTLQGGTGIDTYNVTADTTADLFGGNGNDVFNLNANLTGLVNGQGNDDTFNVTVASNATLLGGGGNDLFDLDATVSGNVTGNTGIDTLQGNVIDNVVIQNSDVNGFDGDEDSFDAFVDLEVIIGNGGTLTGENNAATWGLDGTPTYTDDAVNFLSFGGFTNLQGGSAVDTFNVTANSAFNLLGGGAADVVNLSAILTGNVSTEAGDDVINFLTAAGQVNGNVDGGTSAELNYSALGTAIQVTVTDISTNPADGVRGTATGITGTFDNITTLTGSADGGDSLTGDDVDSLWVIDGTNTYEIGTNVLNFSSIENLLGGEAADTFNVTAATNFTVSGNSGEDAINVANAASLGAVNGSAGDDTLDIDGTGTVASFDGGNDTDTLNLAGIATVNVNLQLSTASGVNTTFTNVEDFVGNGANSTLDGTNGVDNIDITGQDDGNLAAGATTFADFANIDAGSGSDVIQILTGGSITGVLNGEDGADLLDFDAVGSVNVFNGGNGNDAIEMDDGTVNTFDGGADTDELDWDGFTGSVTVDLQNSTGTNITNPFVSVESFIGNNIDSNLIGANAGAIFNLTGANDGNVGGTISFTDFDTVTGGTGNDSFVFAVAGTLDSLIGGLGTDTVDYSAFGTAVTVNLPGNSATNLNAGLSGVENATGGSAGDTLIGDANNNSLVGNDGADTLTDGAGDDTLVGGNGDDLYMLTPGSADVINDTSGSDTADFSGAALGITIDLDSVAVQIVDGANTVQLVGTIENYIGSGNNDTLTADALAAGVTRSLQAGAGANDVLNIDATGLTVTDDGSSLSFSGGFGTISYAGWETLNITGAIAIVITGTAGADSVTITATSNDDGSYQLGTGPAVNFTNLQGFTFTGNGGGDVLTINQPAASFFDPVNGVAFNAGGGGDLNLVGGVATTIEYAFTNNTDGSISFDGEGTPTITYTGLAPITDNMVAANRIFTFNGGAETITLVDAAGANSTIDSTLGESVTFANPTTSLTINAGTGSDTLNLTSVDGAFNANFTVNGDAGTDTVNFIGGVAIGAGNANVDAEAIAFNAGSLTTTGGVILNASLTSISTSGTANDVSANALTATAVTSIDLDTTVTSVTATAGTTITLDETDGLTITGATVTADADANDIVITSALGNITVAGTVTAGTGTLSDVTLTATTGSILDDAADNVTDINGDVVTLTAETAVGIVANSLDTAANFLVVNVTSTPPGSVVIDELNAVTLTSVVTANGLITITSGGAMTITTVTSVTDNDANDITLTANTGDVTVGTVTAGAGVSGDVTITATTGSILDNATDATTDIIGDVVTLTAQNGVGTAASSLDTAANSLDVSVTGAGLINLNETNDVTLTAIDTVNGPITVISGDQMTITNVSTGTDDDTNDITLTATTGNILAGLVSAGAGVGASADVTMTATTGSIIENGDDGAVDIIGDVLTLTAATGVGETAGNGAIDTTAVSMDVSVTGTGIINLNESNAVTLTDIDTANGSITIVAGAAIVATDVVSTTDDNDNDIVIMALTGNITVGVINAGAANGDVQLNADTGSIIDNADDATTDITGDVLQLFAVTGVGETAGNGSLDITANALTSNVTGAGPVNLNETNALTITLIQTANGPISVITGSTMTITTINSLTDVDANDITLTATTGNVIVGGVTNGGANVDTTITATAGSILDDANDVVVDVVGDVVTLTAATGVGETLGAGSLDTTANALDVSVTGVGLINLNESNAVTLADIDTANGSITIVAGGTITAIDVASTTDNDANDITLTATAGNIAVAIITAGATGDVNLSAAAGAITDDGSAVTVVTADVLTANSATGITLDTTAASLTAVTSGAGNIDIDETNGITLTNITAANGSITVDAGGAVTATNVVSTTDTDANDIAINTTTGNISVGVVNAGTANGDVTLSTGAGSILDNVNDVVIDVTGDVVTLNATTGVGETAGNGSLDTAANSLDVSVVGAGLININEVNAVTLTDIDTANGSITIVSGGAMVATDVTSLTDADANDITLTTTSGGITGGIINAGTTAGDVTLNAQGAINVAGLITADNLLADAVGSITANTTINTANLSTSTAGAITIVETNAITLTDVDTANGAIVVTAGGAMIATDVQSLTNNDANDITLVTTGPTTNSITVNTVNAGASGDVTLVSAGAINDDGSAVTVITGDDLVATSLGAITIDTTVVTATVTANAPGNIDIDETNGITLTNVTSANGSITVDAAGSIIATAVTSTTDSDANDITITATAGGTITAGDIDAGATSGDVTLTAAGAVFDDGDLATDVAGDFGTITAVGAIGSSINDLDLDLNTLTTNSNGNAQFLNEANTVVIGAADLNAGASTIRLGGGTFQTTAAGNIITSALTVGDGAGATATLAGDGTVTGTVSVAADGVVAPGFSTAILNTASISFVAGGTFNVEVNGSMAGTLYDQLNVTGTVSLGGATLATSGTITSSPGQVIVLINNDGVDAVSGAFAGFAEGSAVAIGGANFFISYAGGLGGNDVTLTEAGGTVTLSDNDGAADTWEVRRVGANIQVLNGATIVDSRPFAAGTAINILGEDGQHDTLLVNFTGGDPVPAGDISFTGGSGGGMDRVRLLGDGTTTANYTPSATVANAGVVEFDSGNVLNFTGLEPLDIHAMAAVSLTGSAGQDALTVNLSTDFTLGGANAALRVSGTVNGGTIIETLAVWNSGSLTINGEAGNDTVTITNGANTHGINTITLNGGDDNDAFQINGVISASGSVNFNGDAGNDTFTFANAGQILAGPIDGGTGSDTIVGDNDGNAFTVTALNAGTLTGKTTGFANVENLTGGTGTDTFTLTVASLNLDGAINGAGGTDTLNLPNIANVVTITAPTPNSGTANSLGAGFTGIENINGNAAIDTFTLSGGTITGVLNGNGASDILNLDNVNNTVVINTANGGTATGTGGFASIENINGNIQTDTFTLTSGGTLSGNLDGGGAADSDVLTLDNVANIVNINAVNGGTATGIGGTFANIENVTGNNNIDLFTISGGGSLTGVVTGSGNNDTLTLDDVVNTVTITGANSGTATGTGGFATIENIVGGSMDDSFTIISPGSLSGSVNGVGGNDSLTLSNGTNAATINTANGGTATNLGAGFSNIENLNGGTGIDTFTFTNAGSLAGNVTGGTGASNDTIVGDDDGNVFTVNAINGGTLAVKIGGTFADVENLTGGDEGDTFIFTNAGSLVGDVNGGDGSDTLVGDDNGNEFVVTGNDAGTLTGKLDDFTNVENLTGGAGADLFTVNPGASLSEAVSGLAGNDTLNVDGDGIVGSFDGGADTDTLDLADVTTVVVDLENTSATGISGGFSNVETFIGNDTDSTLIGTNAVTTCTINGVNDGSLDVPAGTTFFDFTDLQGGSAADTFNVTGIGDITGSINGGEGADLFNISAAIAGSLDGQGDADTLTGTEIDDVTLTGSDGGSGFGFTGLEADIGGGFAGIDSLAGAAVGTLTGENVDSTWTLDGNGLGDRFYDDGNDVLEFSGFSTVQGGSAIDTFDVTDATTLELRGGDGADIFNLGAALTGDIFAEGGLDQINFQGGSVSGDVDGGSSAELNYSAVGGPISVVVQGLGLIDGYQGTATSIGGIFTNITTVVASSGDDTLTGGDTNSTWELGSTATYQGYGSNQTLQFSDFETLQGGSFSDVFNINEDYSANLNGGTGDDTFNLGATLTGIVDGEAGTDTLQGSEVDQVTLTDLGTVDGFQGDEPNLTHFDNIDALFGNGGTLIGLSIPSIWRLDGTPTYEAGGNILEIGGFENLQGGASTDQFLVTADSTFNLFGGSGHDLFDIDATLTGSVAGQNGNDTLEGDQIDDVTLFGSAGDGFSGGELDITGNFSGINTITGNGGRILGANVNSTWLLDGTPTYSDGSQTLNISGFDTLQGNSAVDRFTVTAASPFSLRGGAGNDIFTFSHGRLTNGGTADGEAGNDTLDGTGATAGLTLAGGGGNDTITGSSFGDSLSGGDGNDIVRGVNGNDTLSGGSGTNTLDGGAGTDTVTDLTTDNGTLTNTLFVGIGRNTLISIERAEIFGDPSDNIIDASAFTLGGVTLHGGAGNDTLIGTGLNDSLDGGDGLDTVRLKFTKNPTNPPVITATNTTLSDNNSTDMLQSIEGLDLTGHATRATRIDAGAFSGFTTLNGGSGNDTLIAGQRDSLAKGGAGHDNITGGAGWDLMYGGAGNDTISGGLGKDILRGEDGNDSLLGGSGDDRLFGDAGRDVIKGGDGQDSIDGGTDNDTILAEGGHDTVTGGAGNDLISGGAGHDTMFGEAGNDTILGDDGDDSISGAAGADVLLGGAGNDKINGGSEKDLVAGQAGDDTLVCDTNEINEFFIFDFHKLLI